MPVAAAWHLRRPTTGRPLRLPQCIPPARLALCSALALVACGEPIGPALGDAYVIDVSARDVYVCAPGRTAPIDSIICGARVDTVELDTRGRLRGRMTTTRIDSIVYQNPTAPPGEPRPPWLRGFTLEGDLQERICNPDCSLRIAPRQAYFDRTRVVCAAAVSFPPCEGRAAGDTVVAVALEVEEMDRLTFGPYVWAVELEVGNARGDYVDYGLETERGQSRRGTRYRVSIERERHYLGG